MPVAYLSFLRRVASVADSAARPVPNKITVTGSGIGTGRGVGVGPTGPEVAVGAAEVAVGATGVAVGATGVEVANSGVGVSALISPCAKTLIDAAIGRINAPNNNATAMITLKCDLRVSDISRISPCTE